MGGLKSTRFITSRSVSGLSLSFFHRLSMSLEFKRSSVQQRGIRSFLSSGFQLFHHVCPA